MKVAKRDGVDERLVLIGMIVDDLVIAHVCKKWDRRLFASEWANIISSWCASYYQQYGCAPKKNIESLFAAWSEDHDDENVVSLVHKFLSSLSSEYETLSEESNSSYVIDRAADLFNKVRVSRLIRVLEGHVEKGRVTKALEQIATFDEVNLGTGSTIDLLSDKDSLRSAFENQSEVLITYPKALNSFFGARLERDGFVAIMAPEKRGKTFWLIDMAWRAATQRRRTAFFAVGDMSEHQMQKRLASRAARRPLKSKIIQYPVNLIRDPSSEIAEPIFKEKEFKDDLTWKEAYKAYKTTQKHRIKSSDSYFKLSVHPNSSISAEGIRAQILEWSREGWMPDVVVIDYADILAPLKGSSQDSTRDQSNRTWQRLRSISQEFHCLVITATQTDANSYNTDLITRRNFSEDKRKFAHVTGMFAINQTEPEKQLGLSRLNWVVLREDSFSESKCVHVAGCLDIVNPAIQSVF